MTHIQCIKAEDFIRKLSDGKEIRARINGYVVTMEERDGSHLFRSCNVHPRNGENMNHVLLDLEAIAKDYGKPFKRE